jgi:carbon storage regulator
MLVLTRKLGEGITIGNNVRVVVLEIKGGQVRIGIEAPQSVQVHRDEIYARIQEENKKAASTGTIPIQAFKTFVKKLGRPTP